MQGEGRVGQAGEEPAEAEDGTTERAALGEDGRPDYMQHYLPEVTVSKKQERLAAFKRIFLFAVVCYLQQVSMNLSSCGIAMTAPLADTRNQLFPDNNKFMSKLEDGMEMMTKFDEFNKAQEVVKLVSWAQQWCAVAGGAEQHVGGLNGRLPRPTWRCTILSVAIADPKNSRALGLRDNICTAEWLKTRIVEGETVHGKDPVPFGYVSAADDRGGELNPFEHWPFMEKSDFFTAGKGWDGCADTHNATLGTYDHQEESNGTHGSPGLPAQDAASQDDPVVRREQSGERPDERHGEEEEEEEEEEEKGPGIEAGSSLVQTKAAMPPPHIRDPAQGHGSMDASPDAPLFEEGEPEDFGSMNIMDHSLTCAYFDCGPDMIANDNVAPFTMKNCCDSSSEAHIHNGTRNFPVSARWEKGVQYDQLMSQHMRNETANRVDCVVNAPPFHIMKACQRSESNVCRNHHWGPLFYLCQPGETEIVFYIESVSATTEQNPHALTDAMDMGTDWDRYFYKQVLFMSLNFQSIGDTGWYQSSVTYDVSRYPLSADNGWVLVMLATVFLWWLISPLALKTLFRWPQTLFVLTRMFYYSHRRKKRPQPEHLKVLVYDLFDYGGRRSCGHGLFPGAKLSFVMILLENAGVYLFLLGVFTSVRALFFSAIYPWETGDEFRPYVQEKCGRDACSVKVFTAIELLTLNNPVLTDEVASKRPMMLEDPSITGGWNMRTIEKAGWNRKLSMWVRMIFFGPDAEWPHTSALFFSITRLFEVFYHIAAWRWLPETMILCAGQVLNFIIILNLMIVGFASYFYGRFGRYFISFHSFGRSYTNLVFYMCSLYDPSMYHLHTYQEQRAFELTISLCIFQVVVVIISLNFFTAIVMTSYGYATGESEEKRNWRLRTNEVFIWRNVFNCYGITSKQQHEFFRAEFPDVDLLEGGPDDDAGQKDPEKKPLLADWQKNETTSDRRKRESLAFMSQGEKRRSVLMDRVGEMGIRRATLLGKLGPKPPRD